METRANHIWVGAVTLALMIGIAALVIWIARLNHPEQNRFDIFFQQSVDGVAKGSSVSYSGVPVGQVAEIALWEKDPAFVRVRITVNKHVPILQGTIASLQGSFTGISTIQLSGSRMGAEPITAPGRDGVPEIPTKRSGLGELLSSAPQLLERLASLADRLQLVLSDQNIQSLSNILANTDKLTGSLAASGPEVKTTLVALQGTIKQATATLASFEKLSNDTNAQLNDQNKGLLKDLHKTLANASAAAAALQATLDEARPSVRQLGDRTLPAAESALRDLQATTRSLRDLTDTIKDHGIGGVLGPQQLPDYKH